MRKPTVAENRLTTAIREQQEAAERVQAERRRRENAIELQIAVECERFFHNVLELTRDARYNSQAYRRFIAGEARATGQLVFNAD